MIATGFAGHRFEPGDGVTRIQWASWLWRTMDRPATAADDPFTDDVESARYADAVDWAKDFNRSTAFPTPPSAPRTPSPGPSSCA